ncbi:MAG: hypothetical protein AB9842_02070 [Bacteroidales bacterium]
MKIIIQPFLKQCIIIFALSFFGYQGMSQKLNTREIKADPRLYECFPKNYVDGLSENPRLLLYYNFYLDHSYFISEPKGKAGQGIDITTVRYKEPGPDGQVKYFNEDLNHFNPKKFCALKYNFRPSPEGYTHYILGNTRKVMIFYPAQDFTKKYNEYLQSFGFDTAK